MSAKVHLHMSVSDLTKSQAFYATFFGGAPVKEKPGYVKFLPEWAPVNLALSIGHPAGEGVVNHVGVQVDSPETVTAHLARVKAAQGRRRRAALCARHRLRTVGCRASARCTVTG